jgi:CHAT domain-containing protein
MSRHPVPVVWCALVLSALGAAPSRETAHAGVVVEKPVPGYEAASAGIQTGDVLVSWQRAANPPANPAPASGFFDSPFDVDDIRFEQGPRARTLTLGLTRNGRSISVSIGQYPWRLEVRPPFSKRWLPSYEKGVRLIEQDELTKGLDAWRSLAGELSAAKEYVEAAWLWSRIGMKLSGHKEADAALSAIERALVEARLAGRPEIEAQLKGLEVEVLRTASRRQDAQKPAREAVAIRERIAPESLALGVALYEWTTVMADEDPEFESVSRRTLKIRERLAPGSRFEADALASLARFAEGQGETRKAIELQQRALAIHRGLDPSGQSVARGLSTLCAYQMNGGDLVGAEESCRRSIEAARALGPASRALVGQALHNMGVVARLRGEFDRAVSLFGQSMEIYEQIDPGGKMVAVNHWDIAATEVSRQDVERLDEAEAHLRLMEQFPGNDAREAALIALVRAEIAYPRKDLAGAEKQLRLALPYFERLAPDGQIAADIVGYLGIVLTDEGRLTQAEELLRRALASSQRFAPTSQKTAEFHHHLGMVLWRAGRTAEAEAALRQALDDLEFQLGRFAGSDEESSSFSAQYADFYKAYVDLLIERMRERDAFLILERYRAGSFLRTLAKRELAVPEEVPPELERERRQANEAYDRTQADIRQLSRDTDQKKIDEGLARLTELRQTQTALAERIRKASPRYGALQYPQPLDLSAATAALDPGTVLLSYSIGREKSLLFVVSSDPRSGPALSVIPVPIGEKRLRDSVEAFRRQIGRNKASPDLFARSRSLYDALVKPAEAVIGRHRRILIAPDGPLHILPWAALVRSVNGERPEYLVEWKPIHTTVSATVYAELRRLRRGASRGSTVELAAFGDPRFPAPAESRVAVTRGDGKEAVEAEPADGDPALDAVRRGGYKFEPLPRTRQEVETIAGLYAPRSAAYLGEDATEERARSIGKDVALIHYACHAYVNERFPLDSALVFTIPDKPRPGQDNGLLQAWEIFEKMRIDADLVTLSACDSGLGKEMGGEGLIGLTRAFQYAGARSVLASLWKVDDESTSELMKRFYGYLKAGRTKDEALRLAQLDLIRSTGYSQPRDWAGFELMGDWK